MIAAYGYSGPPWPLHHTPARRECRFSDRAAPGGAHSFTGPDDTPARSASTGRGRQGRQRNRRDSEHQRENGGVSQISADEPAGCANIGRADQACDPARSHRPRAAWMSYCVVLNICSYFRCGTSTSHELVAPLVPRHVSRLLASKSTGRTDLGRHGSYSVMSVHVA